MCRIVLKEYEGSRSVRSAYCELRNERRQIWNPEDFPCSVEMKTVPVLNGMDIRVEVRALADLEKPAAVSVEFREENWRGNEYVFLPAAVYNGNKMKSIRMTYPPYHTERDGERWINSTADIPRLDPETGSQISFLSGDMSTPAEGYFRKETGEGFLILGEHISGGRYTGFTVKEEKDQGIFSVSAPGVREEKKYFFGELPDGSGFYPVTDYPSGDEGVMLKKGDILNLHVRCYRFRAEDLSGYFREFNSLREELEQGEDFSAIPFSAAFDAVEKKYTAMNFTEEGYYRVGTENPAPPAHWQAGWVGGGMNSYPFLMAGNETARSQAESTLHFIADHLQRADGWYVPMYAEGRVYGDDFRNENAPVTLVRKNADLLYFMVKQAHFLTQKGGDTEKLSESIRAQAEALVRFVKKNGQLGQYIDMDTESLVQGGTACGAIAAAALALAYEYTKDEGYLKTAEYLGEWYYRECLCQGIVNGGPGDMCQALDSESAFGLLESYVQLYETTGNDKWLGYAEDAFELAVTWVVSYDFTFPEESTAAKLSAHTRGTVFANAQNKHSAPGICTLSGNSMLKLYRATGNEKYLRWMRRISRALSQFVSLPDRQIDTLAGKPLLPGYFNERVQMSDWEGTETVGEFLYGSNWPEVSMLLTYVEIPGIYLDLDRDVLVCSDHIHAEVIKKTSDGAVLGIANPTPYDARVTVLAEHGKNPGPIGHLYYEKLQKICLKAGEEKTFCVYPYIKEKESNECFETKTKL